MKTNQLNRKLYTASLIAAIFISSFSSLGSTQVFAQDNALKIRASGTMGAESSLPASAALMPAAALLPITVVRITNTSSSAGGWTPSSPDPSGIDYWPLTGKLLVSDSEVDETPFFGTMNVYQSTTSGTLVSPCSTLSFSSEPSGVAINPNNNHVFFSDDNGVNADRVFELSLGSDGTYCTADDSVVSTPVGTLYGATDAEDVAYGNNTIFIADGVNAEVYVVPLGANGVLGGGDDGSVTHFDTAAFGFHNVEGIGYNGDSGTLFIVSALNAEKILGEISTTGTLLKTYDITGLIHPEDVTYAPGSLNPAIKNIYLTDRGLDNNVDPNENDGRIFEINLGIPRVSSILRASPNPTNVPTVNFTVTFSEAVTGVGQSDFALNVSGVSGATIGGISGSGTTYTVTINTGSGTGTLRLDLNDDNSIRDANNIELGGSSIGDGNFTSGEVYDRFVGAPPAATLVSPTGSIATYNPTYTWNKVSDASWYYIYIQGPSGLVHADWYAAAAVCGASTCSLANVKTVGVGSYTWWIQTWNSVGYGPWSAGMTFTTPTPTPPGAATLVSPSGSITTNNPTYTWNKVTGAEWYYLYIGGPSGYTFARWYAASAVCGATTCSVANATTLGAGAHIWWVQTWNGAGYGPWSTGMSFSPAPPGAATLNTPSGSIATNNPTYTWNEVAGASWYYLYVGGPSNYVFANWYAASAVCSAGTCSVASATNLGSGAHTWWIQTWNGAGYGPWSTGKNFSVP